MALLPYLENQALYDKFHLNEPWDSEHNKKLIAEMPAVFQSRASTAIPPGKTVYLLPRGAGTMFERRTGAKLRDIKDGTAFTIMLVEANADQAVEWTKPQDVEIDLADPFQKLLGLRGDVFIAAFADAQCADAEPAHGQGKPEGDVHAGGRRESAVGGQCKKGQAPSP